MPVYESTPAGLRPLTCPLAGPTPGSAAQAGAASVWMDRSWLGSPSFAAHPGSALMEGHSQYFPLPRRAAMESRATLLQCFKVVRAPAWNPDLDLDKAGLAA